MEDLLFGICLEVETSAVIFMHFMHSSLPSLETINGWNDPPINFGGIKWRFILNISPSYREVLRILPFHNGNNIKLTMNHKMINNNDLRS